ncbi:MAG: SRPBCC family protein [Calditrichaceae bacterium]
MKIIKWIGIVVVGLIVIFLVAGLFLPETSHVERSIIIYAPTDSVYNVVSDYNYYRAWNPWSRIDPQAKGEISGPLGDIGQKWTWESEIIGSGSLTTQKLIPGKYIKSNLVFTSPQAMQSDDIWFFDKAENGTKVTWINEASLDYPVGRYFGLFMDKMIGTDFEAGLQNLKKLCEDKSEVSEGI